MVTPCVPSILNPPVDFIAQFGTDASKLAAMRLWVGLMISLALLVCGAVIVVAIWQPVAAGAGGSLLALYRAFKHFHP